MEHKFESASRMHAQVNFHINNPRVREQTLANCTHIMVSLLKAWKLTVVGIECDDAAFLTSFQEGPHQKLFFQGNCQTSASKLTNCIVVDIVNFLMLLAIY